MKFKFFITLLISSLSVFAQTDKDALFKADIDEIVEKLEFMYGYDQTLREYIYYKSFDKCKTDSIEATNNQNKRLISSSLELTIWKLYINPMDSIHTKELISITKKYGFPSTKRIKKYYKKGFVNPEFNPAVIFIHSPKIYWEELKVLMKSELDEGRVDRCTYGFMLWHLNGRHDWKNLLDNGYIMEGNELKAIDCN